MQQTEDTVTQPIPLAPAPAARPEALTLVQLDQVDALPQVRTESGMDADSLDELGDSIIERGLLQPPLLRWHQGRLAVVAGHRRIEAMRRKGFESFYAIVGDADEDTAFEMQVVENIQREELSLAEEAAAVRRLHDKYQSLGKVAEVVGKSKPWVSKRLATGRSDFGWIAESMLVSGECEDLEILSGISQLEKMGMNVTIMAMRTDDKPLTREAVRQAVAEAKAKAKDARGTTKRKKAEATTPAPFPADRALANIQNEIKAKNGRTVADITSQYSAEQINAMLEVLKGPYEQGHALSMWPAGFAKHRHIVKATLQWSEYDLAEAAAFTLGLNSTEVGCQYYLLFEAVLDEVAHLVI